MKISSEPPAARRGYVRGLPPERVRRLLLASLDRLRRRGTGLFTRVDLRDALAASGAPDDALQSLEAAFFRAVAPIPESRGVHSLPGDSELLLLHREHRLPAVRLDLASILQLNRLLRDAGGEDLTPKLREQLKRGEALERQIRQHGP